MPYYAAALVWNQMPRDCKLSTRMPELHSRRSVTSLFLFLCASWPPSLLSSSFFFVSHHPCLVFIPASPSSLCCEEKEKQGGNWSVGSVITFAMIVFKYQLTHTHRSIGLCFCWLRDLDLDLFKGVFSDIIHALLDVSVLHCIYISTNRVAFTPLNLHWALAS